jgi:hypothetical protein
MKRRPANSAQPWSEADLARLGTMLDKDLAKAIGRSHGAVTHKRLDLEIPAFRPKVRTWTAKELKLLGKMSDASLAAELGVSRKHVIEMRQRRGVKAFSPANTPKAFR